MVARIKKGDTVVVTTGKNKGKKGEILKIFLSENKALVKGVNVVKRHMKPTAANPNGEHEKELPIHLSNLMHLDPKDGKPTRIKVEVKDGLRQRVAKRSGTKIDK
jgi:large subunit ribosomal protein L24